MNQNTPALEVELDELTGKLINITKKINPEFTPVYMQLSKLPNLSFDDWLRHRSISDTREELQILLKEAGVDTASALSLKNLGLNLSDQYWFKPVGTNIEWKDINFFQNDFVSNVISKANKLEKFDAKAYSPNVSSNGELYKFWAIKNGERCLYKDSTKPYYQQAYNEVFASELLEILNIPHVKYTLEKIDDKTYSCCPTFIDENTEYVPALYILDAVKKQNHNNNYQHFLNCIDALSIPCTPNDINTILAFDYIINNEDRHYGNFGFIRNVKTLEYQGLAPIFDNGNSLWYQTLTFDIKMLNQLAKPFNNPGTQEKNLKLLEKHLPNITPELLNECNIKKIAENIFLKNKSFIKDQPRLQAISKRVLSRVNSLTFHLKKHHSKSYKSVLVKSNDMER